jgi:hypothetical protein
LRDDASAAERTACARGIGSATVGIRLEPVSLPVAAGGLAAGSVLAQAATAISVAVAGAADGAGTTLRVAAVGEGLAAVADTVVAARGLAAASDAVATAAAVAYAAVAVARELTAAAWDAGRAAATAVHGRFVLVLDAVVTALRAASAGAAHAGGAVLIGGARRPDRASGATAAAVGPHFVAVARAVSTRDERTRARPFGAEQARRAVVCGAAGSSLSATGRAGAGAVCGALPLVDDAVVTTGGDAAAVPAM